MGGRNYLKPGDRRSKRLVRVPELARFIMRILPRQPATDVPMPDVQSPSLSAMLACLPVFLAACEAELGRAVKIGVIRRGYRRFAGLFTTASSRFLLDYGVYLFVGSDRPYRTLYVGSAAGVCIRHRITSHLGGTRGSGSIVASVDALVNRISDDDWQGMSAEERDDAVRQAAFGRSRWSDGASEDPVRAQAVAAIGRGAFELAALVFDADDRVLARLLERYLQQESTRLTGRLPPLNRAVAAVGPQRPKRKAYGTIDADTLASIARRLEGMVDQSKMAGSRAK